MAISDLHTGTACFLFYCELGIHFFIPSIMCSNLKFAIIVQNPDFQSGFCLPSIRVTPSGFGHKTIFFSENCIGMLRIFSCKNLRLVGAQGLPRPFLALEAPGPLKIF